MLVVLVVESAYVPVNVGVEVVKIACMRSPAEMITQSSVLVRWNGPIIQLLLQRVAGSHRVTHMVQPTRQAILLHVPETHRSTRACALPLLNRKLCNQCVKGNSFGVGQMCCESGMPPHQFVFISIPIEAPLWCLAPVTQHMAILIKTFLLSSRVLL